MSDDFISKRQAIDLAIKHTNNLSCEDKRSWRNKLNKRLTDAIKRKSIQQQHGKLNTNDVLKEIWRWRDCRQEGFPDFIRWGSLNGYMPVPVGFYAGSEVPKDYQESQALIFKRDAEIAQLKPDAEQYRKICVTNRNNAKK